MTTTLPRHIEGAPLRARWLLVCMVALAGPGCEQARFVEEPSSTQSPSLHRRAMHMTFSERGLEQLFARSAPEGMPVRAEGLDLIGPSDLRVRVVELSSALPIAQTRVETSDGAATTRLDLREPRFPIALRVRTASGLRICRWEFEADAATIEADLQVFLDAQGRVATEAVGLPSVTLEAPGLTPLGPCPPIEGREAAFTPPLDEALTAFAGGALEAGALELLAQRPGEAIGLLRGRAELRRSSPYANRRGQILIVGAITEDAPLRFGAAGLDVDLDYAVQPQRAECAPPLDLLSPADRAAGSIEASFLEQFRADVGLALAAPMLARVARSAALSGFACTGLESSTGSTLRRDELLLEQIGLGDVPIGSTVEIAVSPGALPDVELATATNNVGLSWENLNFDLYGEVADGVSTRLASLRVSFDLSLRPRAAGAGFLRFGVDAVTVGAATLTSDWLREPPPDATLNRWARRLLLLAFAEDIVFPLPLRPDAPLELAGSQIRADDVVLFLRFAEN